MTDYHAHFPRPFGGEVALFCVERYYNPILFSIGSRLQATRLEPYAFCQTELHCASGFVSVLLTRTCTATVPAADRGAVAHGAVCVDRFGNV